MPELRDDFKRHQGSYTDPAGSLYEGPDLMLRGIYEPFAEFYRNALTNPIISPMIGKEIIETDLEPNGISGYSVTMSHRKLTPVSFCYEWPAVMLREAALLTLDICEKLAVAEFTLQDGSPWNVVFDATRPIFVDFTSIVQQDKNLLWVAYDQFCRTFLFPLALHSVGLGRISRVLLLDAINGVDADQASHLLPFMSILRLPWLWSRLFVPRWLLSFVHRWGNEQSLNNWSKKFAPSAENRRAFFSSLRNDLQKSPLQRYQSRWASYYSDIQTFFDQSKFNIKQTNVMKILDLCRPKTVTDIGCNQGGYSILAAKAGARVVAFDTDEDSVSLLYQLAQEKQLHILPLVLDILNPSPACGWRGKQFPSAAERYRSQMGFALALVHHLAITQRQTFERIVPALADLSEQYLLTEFVPLDDPRSCELLTTHRRDMSWYTLENYLNALGQEFSKIETFDSYPQGRTLILCTR